MRLYELAKELEKDWREIQALLAEKFGHEAKSHSSSIPADVVRKVRRHFHPEPEPPPPPPAPVVEAPPPPPKPKRKKVKAAPASAPAAEAPASARRAEVAEETAAAAGPAKIRITGTIVVRDLAERLGVPATDVIKALMKLGVMASIHQRIGPDVAEVIAAEHGRAIEVSEAFAEAAAAPPEAEGEAEARPPIVTVMGHVDHGKTTLLDAIRRTRVAAGEAGGITQHIGAYSVCAPPAKGGDRIVFLDTPGHEAFTAMRARGASVTDIAVIVVAADDGVMPQTVEAIHHAQAAGVPIIVAITKTDLPGVSPQRVMQDLSSHGLQAEEWGGQTIMVPVSGKTGAGIDRLLEMILLKAQVDVQPKAVRTGPARAVVIEASVEKGRGAVATVIVRRGTLRVGDPFVVGTTHGKVRALLDDRGVKVKEAGPSTPVRLLGLDEPPAPGDLLEVLPDERAARARAESRAAERREEGLRGEVRVSLEDLQAGGGAKDLPIVLKADARGSVQAIRDLIEKLGTEKARLRVLHDGVGGIVDSDVMLAAASKAVVIGFNVRPTASAEGAAKREGVEIRTYDVIYRLADDLRDALAGLLEPAFEERTVARAEVRRTFKVPKIGIIAGCGVTQGTVKRTARVRVVRDGVQVFETRIASLKRFKDDVREVAEGYECGIGIENFHDIKVGDLLEFYERVEVKPEAAATA